MSIETVISRLDGVKETGYGKYVARCPAHPDKSPSLSIRECDDGRVLIHCHAQCQIEDVLDAVGLGFTDLMPERVGTEHSYKPLKSRFDARQVLAGISHEVMVVLLITEGLASQANEQDQARLILAAARLNNAVEMSNTIGTPPEIKKIRRGES